MTCEQYRGEGMFAAVQYPTEQALIEAAELAPRNPFYSPRYVAARQALGAEPWLLGLRDDRWLVACPAFVTTGRLNRSMELPSWPHVTDLASVWEGLVSFCRNQGISRVEVNSFCSESASFPDHHLSGGTRGMRGVMVSRKRCEYVLDLRGHDPLGRCSSNHARNIKRAGKSGVSLDRRRDIEACRSHAQLMAVSLNRRQDRGERLAAGTNGQDDGLRRLAALVSSGAGELFQAQRNTEILSSILVLRAERGAYYHSAGTSAEGMNCGASHFLVHQIAQQLQAEGVDQFNLGGADAKSGGLERFKAGFGAVPVELEAAELLLAGRLRMALSTAARSCERLSIRIRDFGLSVLGSSGGEALR